MREAERICLYPRLSSTGGPAAFQEKFALGLRERGVDVCYDLNDRPYRAVILIGGTRRLGDLRRARRSGVPVIQRLDGMNWIHRRRRTGLAHYLRAEYGNLNLSYIRRRLADRVVYQSQFARRWWEGKSGLIEGRSEVIYNGVDLETYTPDGPESPPSDRWRILLVEGSLAGGYDVGLENAAELVRKLQPALSLPAELVVAGAVPKEARSRLEGQPDTPIVWSGQLPMDRIPGLDRSAHLLFSADLNAACPNSVVEALACGLPVLSFSSGALPEMVTPGAGKIVPYGGDPWSLGPPDLEGLAEAGLEILNDQVSFRAGARARAVERFGLEEMVARYLEVVG